VIGIVQEVSDHGLHFLAFLVGAGPLGRGGGKVGGVMKMVPIKYLLQVLQILAQEKLYGNLEKCHLFTPQVIFLGYVVSA